MITRLTQPAQQRISLTPTPGALAGTDTHASGALGDVVGALVVELMGVVGRLDDLLVGVDVELVYALRVLQETCACLVSPPPHAE